MEDPQLDPTVALAALDLEIGLVEETRQKMLAGTGRWVGNNDSPEGTAFVLKELAAEKARYEEERRALLEKMEPHRAPTSAAEAAPSPTPSIPRAPAAPPEPSPEQEETVASPAAGLSAELTADQKSAAQTTVMWMDAVTLGTYDAPRRAADLYAPDGVLWGTEVYGPDDPLWGTVLELVRNTPEQIYAYYDHFARLPKLRVVEYTPGPVRVHGDFAAQDGAHRFSWQGVDGSTVEMRARFSLTFRRVVSSDDGSGSASVHPWEIVEHCSFSMPTAPPAGELTLKEMGSKAAAAATDDDITGDVAKKHHRQQRRRQKPQESEQHQQQQRQVGAEVSAAAAQAVTTAPSSPLVSPSLQVAADAVTPDGSSASVREPALPPPPVPSPFFSESTAAAAAATKAAAASKAAAATKAAGSQGYWSFILNRYVWKPKAVSAADKRQEKRRQQENDEDSSPAKERIDELKQRAEIAEIRAAELAALLAKERAAIRRAVQQTRAAAPKYVPQPQPQPRPRPEEEEQKQEKEKEAKVQEEAYTDGASGAGGVDPAGTAAATTGGMGKREEVAGGKDKVKQASGSGEEKSTPLTRAAAAATSATVTAAMATATAATATATAATATATAATATATAATATATAVTASAAQGERGARKSSRSSAARLGERVEKARYLAAELAKQMAEIEERAASLAECDRVVAAARASSSTGAVHGGSLSPNLDEQHPKMLV